MHIRGGEREHTNNDQRSTAGGHTHINKMTKAAPPVPQTRKSENMRVGRWSQGWPLELVTVLIWRAPAGPPQQPRDILHMMRACRRI
eukprot:gene11703-biopygen3376